MRSSAGDAGILGIKKINTLPGKPKTSILSPNSIEGFGDFQDQEEPKMGQNENFLI